MEEWEWDKYKTCIKIMTNCFLIILKVIKLIIYPMRLPQVFQGSREHGHKIVGNKGTKGK